MKRNYFILFLFLLTIISSCKKSQDSSSITSSYFEINMDDVNVEDTLFFSQIFNKTDLIQLSDQVIIGEISKLLLHNGELFILDKLSSCVFVFDNKGNFRRIIGSKGVGPGEMIAAVDMAIDKINNYLYILDIHSQRINTYNITDGNYILSESFSLDLPMCSNIYYQNDTIYLSQFDPSNRKLDYLYRVLSLSGKETHFIVPIIYNKSWDNALANYDGPFLISYVNKPLLSHLFMDTIFEYLNGKLKPYLVLSGDNKNKFKKNDFINLDVNRNPMDMIKIFSMEKYFDIHNYMDTDTFILFNLNKGSKTLRILYDKEKRTTKKIMSFKEDLFFNNIDINQLPLNFGVKENDSICYYINPSDWEILQISLSLLKSNKTKNKLRQINRDAFNGILFCYEFK